MDNNVLTLPPPVLSLQGPQNPNVLSYFFDCSLQKPLYVGEVIEHLKLYFGVRRIETTWFSSMMPFEAMAHLEGWGDIVVHKVYFVQEPVPVLLCSDAHGRLLEIRTWNHKQIKEFLNDAISVEPIYAWSITALNLPRVQEDFRVSGIDIRETF